MMHAANLTTLWAELIAAELVRLRVKLVCIAPGSRCTPLVAACARRAELEKVICQDERSAAFCALGYGRATKTPAVVISTSGSAVANLFPAVVEASNDHVPLLVFTADRPPELRAVGANQTIDQTKIFGIYARAFVDVPVPDPKISLRFLLASVDEAHAGTIGSSPGPVHMNFMFREPFDVDHNETWDASLLDGLTPWMSGSSPYTLMAEVEEVASVMRRSESGVIIAGSIRDPSAELRLVELAEKSGFVLLPDVLSNLRFVHSAAVANFVDLALLDERLHERTPDVILQFGGRLVSKRLQQFLDKGKSHVHVLVDSNDARLDPGCVATHRLRGGLAQVINSLIEGVEERPFLSPQWLASSAVVEKMLDKLHVDDSLTEISVARSLLSDLRSNHFLFCASSMPIRDLNMFGAIHCDPPRIYANRGASGIDGVISSASGVSKALKKPGVLLSGDLTFIYDTNGLSLLKWVEDPLVIVVVNNQGGGIFTMLDVHRQSDIFTPYFDAEHDTDLSGLCAAYHLDYERVDDLEDWQRALPRILSATRHRVIEVVSNKWKNKDVHDRVRDCIREAFREL